MPCSHSPWVQTEWQSVTHVTRVTCSPTADGLAGRRWRALCCWTWTHVFQLTQRPSDFEPVYHRVPMAKASTNHPQSQHQQHSLGPSAPQLLPPRKLQERMKAKENTTCLVNIWSWHKTIYPGWNSPLNLPHGGKENSLLSIYRLEKYSTSWTHCVPQWECTTLLAVSCTLEY